MTDFKWEEATAEVPVVEGSGSSAAFSGNREREREMVR